MGDPGNKYAKSALTDKFDGASVSTNGNLFANFVKYGTSVEKSTFKPNIVLSIGSEPKFIFGVNGLSITFKMVPPRIKFSEKRCSTSIPIKVLRCWLKTALFSVDMLIGVPEACKPGSKICTLPN